VIPLAAVKTIEVSPGSRSAGSGDAAIGGVVNLLTNSATLNAHQDLSVSRGSFKSYRVTATSGLNLGRQPVESVLESSGRGDHFAYPDADTTALRRGVQARAWRAFVGLAPGEQSALRASGFVYNATVGIPGALEQLQPGATSHNARHRAKEPGTGREAPAFRRGPPYGMSLATIISARWRPESRQTANGGSGSWERARTCSSRWITRTPLRH